MATFEELTAERPDTRARLRRYVQKHFGLRIPSRRVCEGHDAPLDYLAASFLQQDDLLVWANRGGGKTMLAAVATVLDGLFHGPARLRVLGGSFDQSDRLADYIRDILDAHPDLVAGRMTRQRVRLAGWCDGACGR